MLTADINDRARRLFRPLAAGYERWARVLSLGQDARWRSTMVDGLAVNAGGEVLDVAAGTGSISRRLEARGLRVLALDQSREMVREARRRGTPTIIARAEALPFRDQSFDGLTFGYLLRYVDDPAACLRELRRVVRPGGAIGMVEFGRPRGVSSLLWRLYTRVGLPAAGAAIGSGWYTVGRFLGPSIDAFHRKHGGERLEQLWRAVGLEDVRVVTLSFGGGIVVWARRA